MGPQTELRRTFADLHLHIGSTSKGEQVKISASHNLTFRQIAHEASHRKGISLLGVIDCHSPGVQEDIAALLESGEMEEVTGGGIRYRDTTIMLGAEIEVRDPGYGIAHHLVYLPTFEIICEFTNWMSRHMRNVRLSSQRIYVPARVLQEEVKGRGGLFIPAHIFTPHKSLYGSCSDRLGDTLDPSLVDAVELGLSADSSMASALPELGAYPFLSNSDAHSLAKIGREYNAMLLAEPSFAELTLALKGSEGRAITANYGLNPLLGKYHRTYCLKCGKLASEAAAAERCPTCGSIKLVRGVMDRIEQLAAALEMPSLKLASEFNSESATAGGLDLDSQRHRDSLPATKRPPYVYQVPLEFMPGVGKKTLQKMLDHFGTEMNILHDADYEALEQVAGEAVAGAIMAAREGSLALDAGGGGQYGRVKLH